MAEKVEQGRANARLALDAYRSTGRQDPDDSACIGDLIADLLHLAEEVALDDPEALAPAALAERAQDHYEYESNPHHSNEEV